MFNFAFRMKTSRHFSVRFRLSLMIFLEFAVWGCWLTSLGNYLGRSGMGTMIAWFFAMQGIWSLITPTLMGYIADRWTSPSRLLALCHLLYACAMGSAGYYGVMHVQPEFWPLFILFSIALAFFMPTIALANSVAFKSLRSAGLDTGRYFPQIRVFGSVGFIAAMLLVNFTQFQTNAWQLMASAAIAFIMGIYSLTLPDTDNNPADTSTLSKDKISILQVLSNKYILIFLAFAMLMGVAQQVTNSYGNIFISSFGRISEYADAWASNNANALISISQISETICILLIPIALKKLGLKRVIFISMLAWTLRFWLYSIGNPGTGLWALILSCIVYGVAFDFLSIAGGIYVDRIAGPHHRAKAQGMLMGAGNGIGGTIGILIAQLVVNNLVFSQKAPEAQLSGWTSAWFIFGCYTLVVAVLFLIFFREGGKESGLQDRH